MRRRLRRRTRGSQGTVSLFSFIDVIGGMIGALSLIIISISLSNVVPESSSASPLNSQIRLTDTQIQQKTDQITRMREAILEINVQQTDVQNARNKLVTLQQGVNQMADRQLFVAGALKEKQKLHKKIKKLKDQRDKLQTVIAGLDKTPDEKKGKTLRDRIEVHFTGRGKNLKPTFVECTEKGLIITDGETIEIIINHIISTSDKYHLLLEHVKERPGGTVIFLIRPDGIRSFNLALTRANNYKVRSGKLPVPGSGEIDLNHYKE